MLRKLFLTLCVVLTLLCACGKPADTRPSDTVPATVTETQAATEIDKAEESTTETVSAAQTTQTTSEVPTAATTVPSATAAPPVTEPPQTVPPATAATTTVAASTAKQTTTATRTTRQQPPATTPPQTTKAPTAPRETTTRPTTTKPATTTTTEPQALTCSLSIDCKTVLSHWDELNENKKAVVPANGVLLQKQNIPFKEGETVFDVLQRTCRGAGLHMEFSSTPVYSGAYIEGIGNLYEFDCGVASGWTYSVNGVFPNYGCGAYVLHDGDSIAWRYTCDLGADVGGHGQL